MAQKQSMIRFIFTSLLLLSSIDNSYEEFHAHRRFRRNSPNALQTFNAEAGLPADLDDRLSLLYKIESGKTPLFLRGAPNAKQVDVDADSIFAQFPDKKNIDQKYNAEEMKALKGYINAAKFTKVPHIRPKFEIIPSRLNYFNGKRVYPVPEMKKDFETMKRLSDVYALSGNEQVRKMNSPHVPDPTRIQDGNPVLQYPTNPWNDLSRVDRVYPYAVPKQNFQIKPERTGLDQLLGSASQSEQSKLMFNQLKTPNPVLFALKNKYVSQQQIFAPNQFNGQKGNGAYLQNQMMNAMRKPEFLHYPIHQNSYQIPHQNMYPGPIYKNPVRPPTMDIPNQTPHGRYVNMRPLNQQRPSYNPYPYTMINPVHDFSPKHEQLHGIDKLDYSTRQFTDLVNSNGCVRPIWEYIKNLVVNLVDSFIVFRQNEKSKLDNYLRGKPTMESDEIDQLLNKIKRIRDMLEHSAKMIQSNVKPGFSQNLDEKLRNELIMGMGKIQQDGSINPEITNGGAISGINPLNMPSVLNSPTTKVVDSSFSDQIPAQALAVDDDTISARMGGRTEQYEALNQPEKTSAEGQTSETTLKTTNDNQGTTQDDSNVEDSRRSLQQAEGSETDTKHEEKGSGDEFIGLNPENKGVDVKEYYIKSES